MNSLFANTTNHRRFLMFVASGIFALFTGLIFYQIPYPMWLWNVINTASIGVLVFEFLYQFRKLLNLKTLFIFVMLVAIISQFLQMILYNVESGVKEFALFDALVIKSLFLTFPYNLYSFIESLTLSSFAYYLIICYKKDGWMIPTVSTNPTESRMRDLAVGFFGWFLLGNLILAFNPFTYSVSDFLNIFVLLTIGLIFYLFWKNKKWIGTGIVIALITNSTFFAMMGFMSIFTPFTLYYPFIPLPMGLFLLMQ